MDAVDDLEPQKPPWLKQRDGDYTTRVDYRDWALKNEQQRHTTFKRTIAAALEPLSTFTEKARHIDSVTADMYNEHWILLMLQQLRDVRENSQDGTRRIIVEMVGKNIVTPQQAARAAGISRTTVYNWMKAANIEQEEPLSESPTTPEPQPVAAAIVTSRLGVLAGQRNDGKPPWTFIAGEIEPGESPADAAIRETKEEAGLIVAASHTIGRRVHPKTGRTMIYLACTPTEGTGVHVGDPEELAAVRWLSLAKADDLMPGMFEPVHSYLSDTIGD